MRNTARLSQWLYSLKLYLVRWRCDKAFICFGQNIKTSWGFLSVDIATISACFINRSGLLSQQQAVLRRHSVIFAKLKRKLKASKYRLLYFSKPRVLDDNEVGRRFESINRYSNMPVQERPHIFLRYQRAPETDQEKVQSGTWFDLCTGSWHYAHASTIAFCADAELYR